MTINFSKRQKSLFEDMGKKGLDALLVTNRKDIFYFTGFMNIEGDFCTLLFKKMKRKPVIFLSSLSNRAENLLTAEVNFVKKAENIVKALGKAKKIGIDEKDMRVSFYKKIDMLAKGARLLPASSLIKKGRTIKDSGEIRNIKKSVRITEEIMTEIKNDLIGRTEDEISRLIEIKALEKGASLSFETIVSSGKNSALIHYIPGKRRIRENDLVVIDMGTFYKYYSSDMTRTFCAKPDKRQKELHSDILEIQNELIDNIHSGVLFDDITALYQTLLKKKRYEFMHLWGHGVGLDVHDPSCGILEEGMIVTVEPGAYIKGFGGCRIEDMILVGKSKNKKLTRMSSEL